MSSLRSLVAFKQVVRAKKSGESVITNPKVARSLGERQLRNRLHGCPAFFVSPVRWRTGHWIRKLTCQSKCPKGHLQGMFNTDYNADLWHVNRKSLLNIVFEYREIVNCQILPRNSRK